MNLMYLQKKWQVTDNEVETHKFKGSRGGYF